jgi:hypothetical protein
MAVGEAGDLEREVRTTGKAAAGGSPLTGLIVDAGLKA